MRIELSRRSERLHRDRRRSRMPPISLREHLEGLGHLLRLWMLTNGPFVLGLSVRAWTGQRIALWQWLLCVTMFPLIVVVVGLGVALPVYTAQHFFGRFRHRMSPDIHRCAEIRGGRVYLGPDGYTFRPALLIACKIEPDPDVPEFSRIWFRYRPNRWSRPVEWSMLVEDLDEAEAFQRELVEQAT